METGRANPGWTLTCHVVDHAACRFERPVLAELHRHPGTVHGLQLSPAFFKHADEQTVAAFAAMKRAMARRDRDLAAYADWGIVVGPAMFGREPLAQTIVRFQEEGAWGVTPHSIPYSTLHAASGTLSQAFQIRGPNVSVGSSAGAAVEAILVASTFLAEGNLPSVWLVLTGYERELLVLPDEKIPCFGVALALTKAPSAGQDASFRAHFGSQGPTDLDDFTLASFCEKLSADAIVPGRWRLPGAGWLELEPT